MQKIKLTEIQGDLSKVELLAQRIQLFSFINLIRFNAFGYIYLNLQLEK